MTITADNPTSGVPHSLTGQSLIGSWAGDENGHRAAVHELVTAQARAHPDRVALRTAGGGRPDLTYAELDRQANRLAQHLIAAGTRPGDVVAVYFERSVEEVVALLAILKAGGAYLALDPRYPRQRHEDTVQDAGTTILLTVSRHAADVPPVATTILLDQDETVATRSDGDPAVPVSPEAAAYVAYTSGSTGKPKGAAVTHQGVTRLVIEPDYLSIAGDEVFLYFAPLAFDASTLEIWGALANGCRLVIQPAGDPSLRELADTVHDEGVTVLWLTSGLFHQMADGPIARMTTLRSLLAGGDVLSVPHVNRTLAALPGVRLINGYGPTENTTFTCCQPITEPVAGPVPIGRAIRGTRMYVLDDNLEPVPAGEVGELYSGGLGVAIGYLNRRALTAEKFLPDPYSARPGARMYRTGDLVRWRADGALDFLGRADKQLKIRGFRIECGEIEAVLTAADEVADAVVVGQPMPGGSKILAAFVVPAAGATVPVLELRERLAAGVPSYAVPSSITVLDALPLNANGKVDRRALEELRGQERPDGMDTDYRAPEGEPAEELAALWSATLGIAGIGVDDDFFQLGGHSLLAVRIIEEIRGRYAADLPMRQFYLSPTIAGLAEFVTAESFNPASSFNSATTERRN